MQLINAAYKWRHTTTEDVFPIKINVEITFTSKNENLYLIFLDISEASNTINRNKLHQKNQWRQTVCYSNSYSDMRVRLANFFMDDTRTAKGDCS